MLLSSPKHDTWAALTALAAAVMTGQSTAMMAGLLTVWTAMGLLAEWQARRTLVTLARTEGQREQVEALYQQEAEDRPAGPPR